MASLPFLAIASRRPLEPLPFFDAAAVAGFFLVAVAFSGDAAFFALPLAVFAEPPLVIFGEAAFLTPAPVLGLVAAVASLGLGFVAEMTRFLATLALAGVVVDLARWRRLWPPMTLAMMGA